MKKKFTICLSITIIICTAVFVIVTTAPKKAAVPFTKITDLSTIKVGETIYIGDIAIERVTDGTQIPINDTKTTKQGFTLDFNGQKQDVDDLRLNDSYRYFYIYINNEGNTKTKWMITIGNTEEDQSRNFFEYDKGTWVIWSTNAWPAVDTEVGFTCGEGLYGKASAKLFAKLDDILMCIQ